MGIFGNLFNKKKAEQKRYWSQNQEELRQIEESGKMKLSIMNDASTKIDASANIKDIVASRDTCIPILEWYAILDERGCPYHIIGGAETFKINLLKRYNAAIVAANKYSSEDFATARNLLCKDVDNYDLCLSELSMQANDDHFYGTTQRWINTVKRLFDNNQAMDNLNIYVECGMPQNIAFDTIVSLIPFVKGSDEHNKYLTYHSAITNRYALSKFKLPLAPWASFHVGLNIPNNETIYHQIGCLTTFYEVRTVIHNITYSGIRWSKGPLRAGTISAIGNEIQDFVPQGIGFLFITDKRLLFIDKQENVTKAIKINDILTYNLYNDGVVICQANKKPILLKFSQNIDFEAASIGDGLNEFVIVLNRIISGTENDSLQNTTK